MKGFEEFSIMSNEKKEEIWSKALFVFDANVLLNLYRYTEETANDLLYIMTMMKERIWIPHQVGLEYNYNRVATILQQTNSYNSILKEIDSAYSEFSSSLRENLKNYKNRHPRIDIDELFYKIEENIADVKQVINSAQNSHPDLLEIDPYYEKIIELFDGKIGEPFNNQSELDKIYEEGSKRYENLIPPGYKDLKDKKGKKRFWNKLLYKNEYGDLLVWKQILDKAKEEKKIHNFNY
ncbi:PIN-like domain-containing protein [Paenibacillus polymyxa]|uniref:PIN-like domain-containing protein n=1 Tax=Paenibacillus polymyxa TaxID=1406 RepID=UPI002AB56484|nr:PIN-like domain-containing protein [Paenibacillus polymyxa]MDY7989876.1 PIN-like domain-containing protein [Paenibacillus polymyxa]MDY8116765.1 PIN-like domain-containing protein [Paenibacillus polymyxa]